MKYFEFLDGSRVICFPFNIPEKLREESWKSQKSQRLIAFLSVYTIQYSCTLKSNIHHSKTRGPPPFFHLDTSSVLDHVLIHSAENTFSRENVLVVKVELIWLLVLNILYFNFVPSPNKFLRLKRFRKSYVNCSDVVLTNHKLHCLRRVTISSSVQHQHHDLLTFYLKQAALDR